VNTVPKAITPALLAFCRQVSTARPIYVRSRPGSDAQPSACFDNVARKVERAGGDIAYGWAIWHVPGLYYEAEHHGVWRNRQRALLDVSPQLDQVPKILFLSDSDAVYDPAAFRPNRFKAANDSALALEFVELARARNDLLNRYRSEYTIAMLTPIDQDELGRIDQRMKEIWAEAGVLL
jgi:hypothetical protein